MRVCQPPCPICPPAFYACLYIFIDDCRRLLSCRRRGAKWSHYSWWELGWELAAAAATVAAATSSWLSGWRANCLMAASGHPWRRYWQQPRSLPLIGRHLFLDLETLDLDWLRARLSGTWLCNVEKKRARMMIMMMLQSAYPNQPTAIDTSIVSIMSKRQRSLIELERISGRYISSYITSKIYICMYVCLYYI